MTSTVAEIAERYMQIMWENSPTVASVFGVSGHEDQLPDLSVTAQWHTRQKRRALLEQARTIQPDSAEDALTLAVLIWQLEHTDDTSQQLRIESCLAGTNLSPVPATLQHLETAPCSTEVQARGFLTRLRAVPIMLRQAVNRHRRGVRAGRTPVAHLVRETAQFVERYEATLDTAWGPDLPAEFQADKKALLEEYVRPALQQYRAVLLDEIAPAGRATHQIGLCWLPGGKQIYAEAVVQHTTLDRPAADWHTIGHEMMAELHAEVVEIGRRLFGLSEVSAILHRLRTDPDLRWGDAEEMLHTAREAIDRATQVAPAWFSTVPTHTCPVSPIPEAAAAGAPAAYYLLPSLDGARLGQFWLNTSCPEQRFRHQLESLVFHEAVPGHHFEKSLLMEGLLPMVRRADGFTAYSEGWGLYAERLADEMGLYSRELDRLGMLSGQMLRAARLVVDTGIHEMAWPRDRAIEYLELNTDLPRVEVEAEVDRYTIYPGQALAYMAGQREITELRAEAEAQWGESFDLQSWHKTLLELGPLPLELVIAQMRSHRFDGQ